MGRVWWKVNVRKWEKFYFFIFTALYYTRFEKGLIDTLHRLSPWKVTAHLHDPNTEKTNNLTWTEGSLLFPFPSGPRAIRRRYCSWNRAASTACSRETARSLGACASRAPTVSSLQPGLKTHWEASSSDSGAPGEGVCRGHRALFSCLECSGLFKKKL